jgi:hypothetical protein
MLKTLNFRRLQTGALALVLLAGMAMQAEARQFRMTGNWLQNRSAQLQIPLFGGINNAPGAMVTANGTMNQAVADLTIKPGAFSQTGPPIPGLPGLVVPLPKTTIVQISTMFFFAGPGTADSLGNVGPGGTGFFVTGSKGTRPANFAWCPGAAANPACTTPQTGGSQGSTHGIVAYTAGANQFGGTMAMLTGGAGSLSTLVGTAPIRVKHNSIGNLVSLPVGAMLDGVIGGVYSGMTTLSIPAGPVTTGGVCAGGPCGTNGVVLTPGVTTQLSGGNSSNINFGFPWTTGMITGIATEDLPVQPSTFTSTGSDNRTVLGAGNITLVAGGLSHRFPADSVFIMLDKITMTISPRNLPSMSPTGIAALVTVLIAGAGYAVRRRK